MKREIAFLLLALAPGYGAGSGAAQSDTSRMRVDVVLVQLSVAITDSKGNYIDGLRPEDFIITEDKIPEKIATFEEGNAPPVRLIGGTAPTPHGESNQASGSAQASSQEAAPVQVTQTVGAQIFILFDTSNYMYRGFVFAQDSIADFIRSLEGVKGVALYSYSRDLTRISALTDDRSQILHGVRNTVAGDSAALYNSLLLTVQDAALLTGKKAVVVFSNGPDNASLVPPEDVAELAQSTGTIIYMISTQLAEEEPISAAVFERISNATGGRAYFSKNWRDEKQAFNSIRDDLAHLYTLSYYPQTNPNRGWRAISVKLVGKNLQRYHIRTRDGYRLLETARSKNPLPLPEKEADSQTGAAPR